MPTPPDQNIPLIVFKPFIRRGRTSDPEAPPGARHPAPHPARGTVVSDNRPHLGVGVRGNGVDPRAFAAVHKVLDQLLGNNPSIQAKLTLAHTIVVIIPRDKRLTDLEDFADLRGTRAQDGRSFDDLAGMGGHYLANDNFAVAVPEENLVRIAGVKDTYGAGYSVAMHEIAHAIFSKGLDSTQRTKVDEFYAAHKATTAAHWTDSYAATNVQEYFAQSTNAYFNENAGVGHGGRAWLQDNDPEMCALLDKVYGPRSDAAPTPTAAPARK